MPLLIALIPLLKIAADITMHAIREKDPRRRDVRHARTIARARRKYAEAVVRELRHMEAGHDRRNERAAADATFWRTVLEELGETP